MVDNRLNCWEYQGCGHAAPTCSCPAARSVELDGLNRGHNGGRACWAVSNTMCEGQPSGAHEQKFPTCSKCAFYLRVVVEEGVDLVENDVLLAALCVDEPTEEPA